MQLSMISFTKNGMQLSNKIAALLENPKIENMTHEDSDKKIDVSLYTKCQVCINDHHFPSVSFVVSSVGDWAEMQMRERKAMLFVGACGIAVRAIAPSLTDKLQDSPVLVMDEKGRYIIPILSGHMGGANELASYIARRTGAEAVITTATDINDKFAVDLFAKKNGLFIVNKDGIVKVSAKVLAGETITMSIETNDTGLRKDHVKSGLTAYGNQAENAEVQLVPYPPDKPVDVVVTSKEDVFDAAVLLKPREYIIGMGCKKGKKAREIEDFIAKKINELGICITQVFALSSISQKRNEPGMVQWCQKQGVPFLTYTAEELQDTEGDFTESSFVKAQVGVDNVCERAALKACGEGGTLVASKCAENGMTIAVAKREWMADFYDK